MNLARNVFKNVSYLLIARSTFRFLTALALIYAASYLGKERYGMFETATAWANTFIALNDLGMSTLIVREGARDEKKMAVYFGNTLLVETVLSIVLFFVVIGIGVGFGYDKLTLWVIALITASNLLFEFRKVMRGVFRVTLNMKIVAMIEVLNGALFCIITLAIVWMIKNPDRGLLGIAQTSLWVDAFCILLLFIFTLRIVKPKLDVKLIWPMIKQSYVFTLYNVFFMLYFQIDQILLSIMRGSGDVGIYSAAAKIVTVLLFVPLMFFQVTMPIMYRLSANDMEKYKRVNHAVWKYLAAFGVPAGLGLWYLADQIIPLAYRNPEFLPAIAVMQVFGWFLAIRFIGIGQGNSLTTTDRQGLRAALQAGSLVVNILLAILFIREYGVVGAAYATLITEALITISSLVLSARYLQESLWRNFLSIVPVFAATVVMVGVLSFVKPHAHLLVSVAAGAAVYAIFLWLFRFFKPYDREIIMQIVQGKKGAKHQESTISSE